MGPAGFWCGFIIGLTSAAIMMMPDAFSAAPAVQHHLNERAARNLHGLRRIFTGGLFRSSSQAGYNGALYIPLLLDTKDSLIASRQTHIVVVNSPQWGYSRNQVEDFRMKSISLVPLAAAMGLSSCFRCRCRKRQPQQPAILPFTIRNITKRHRETGSRAESTGGEETPQSCCKTGC